MYNLGLIGKPLTHSFSKKYFESKFKREKIKNYSYSLYPINLENFNQLVVSKKIIGLNVTRPYKKKIINYLDELDETAKNTQAVNTIFINPKNNQKLGFNTDLIGFESTLKKFKLRKKTKGLILGSGSVSRTISYALKKQNIKHIIVSRQPIDKMINYSDIKHIIHDFKLIINTTPLGQYPNTNTFPNIPYELISPKHYCMDLTYNPVKTIFLEKCKKKGALILNGEKMLKVQAELAWEIWNNLIKKNV